MFASTRIRALADDVTQRAESHTLPPVSVIIGPTEQCRSYIVSVWAQSKVVIRAFLRHASAFAFRTSSRVNAGSSNRCPGPGLDMSGRLRSWLSLPVGYDWAFAQQSVDVYIS
jgi:hypothetical protein